MPSSPLRWAAAAASLVLAVSAGPAFAADGSTVGIHQPLPLTATSKGVSNEAKCADIPATKDGWHFVLPGNTTVFTKLTVTFEPGGQQVITDFGPPSDKHAYAASVPGAKLVSATAEVEGDPVKWFNLSHTCPGKAPSGTPSVTPSGSPSVTASPTVSAPASGSPSAGAPATVPGKPGAGVSQSPSGAPSSAAPAPSGSSSAAPVDGDLAETGSDTPVGLIAALAAALVGAGALLMVRRRRAQ
ncbi:LPXTG cell wall anchor domain-containing protein [Streptomyces sp. NPDC051211]|uniref:LPXTG cell wall anchor domain-containing protein n=1 Tax=Streptomyces sp. NPDC051211 TaxID=3154643 RepID=UPI00344C04A1